MIMGLFNACVQTRLIVVRLTWSQQCQSQLFQTLEAASGKRSIISRSRDALAAGKRTDSTMFGRKLPPPYKSQKLLDLYATTLKVSFQDERAKYYKLISLMNDYSAFRINMSNFKPRVEEIMKDHPKLLLGFSVFCREDIVYLPEARVSPSPGLTIEDASRYMDSVEEAFYEEPAKYDEFLKILLTPHRADEASAIAKKLEELMKDHQNLLQGFSVFFSAEPKITHPSRVCCAS